MGNIGQRIQELRQLLSWSQRELSKRASVPNSTVSMVEQGRVSPSLDTLHKLAQALGLAETSLFRISDRPAVQVLDFRKLQGNQISLERGIVKPVIVSTPDDIFIAESNCHLLCLQGTAELLCRKGTYPLEGPRGVKLGEGEPYRLIWQPSSLVISLL